MRTRVEKLEKNLLPTPEKKVVHGTIWTAPSIVTDAISKTKKCFDKYVAREKCTVMRTLSWKPPTHKLNLNSQNPNDACMHTSLDFTFFYKNLNFKCLQPIHLKIFITF